MLNVSGFDSRTVQDIFVQEIPSTSLGKSLKTTVLASKFFYAGYGRMGCGHFLPRCSAVWHLVVNVWGVCCESIQQHECDDIEWCAMRNEFSSIISNAPAHRQQKCPTHC